MEKKYSIEEVYDIIGEEHLLRKNERGRQYDKCKDVIVEGYKVRLNSLRYMTFYQKGTTCVCCGKKGAYFKLDGTTEGRRHFNLYAADGTLMTKDHIVPRSKGGKNNVDNMQTMCFACNVKKGNGS